MCTDRQEEYKEHAGREDREHLCATVKTVPCPSVSLFTLSSQISLKKMNLHITTEPSSIRLTYLQKTKENPHSKVQDYTLYYFFLTKIVSFTPCSISLFIQ